VRLRNDRGTPVDPVPFAVVAATAFLVCFSFGPLYCLALGFDLQTGLVASGVVFVAATVVAYHRLVRRARPDLAGEVPAHLRLRQVFYLTALLTLVLLLLTVPLV
jgi:hypothetical protein